MYRYLKGIYLGRQLSKSVATICQATTNHLIINGFDIKLPDTVKILQESYAFCLTISSKPGRKITESGTTVEVSKYLLKNWLKKVFQSSNTNHDFNNSITLVIDGLLDYWRKWYKKLGIEHNELQGKPNAEWIPSAISKFIIEIESYISSKFLKTPDKFSEFLMLHANDCVNQIGVKD